MKHRMLSLQGEVLKISDTKVLHTYDRKAKLLRSLQKCVSALLPKSVRDEVLVCGVHAEVLVLQMPSSVMQFTVLATEQTILRAVSCIIPVQKIQIIIRPMVMMQKYHPYFDHQAKQQLHQGRRLPRSTQNALSCLADRSESKSLVLALRRLLSRYRSNSG